MDYSDPKSRFTSTRERRLWSLIGLTIGTIFSTLSLAQSLVDWLIDRELSDSLFGLGMVLICGSILLVGLKTRPKLLELGIWLSIVAIYLILFARMTIPEERTHLIEYSVLALLIFEALRERAAHGRAVWRPALLAFSFSSSIGILDEAVQFFIPNRFFDIRDIFFNLLASAMAVGAVFILNFAKTQWGSG